MSSTGSDYFRRVLSPWVPGVDNPLPRWVEQLARPDGTAIDVGCGPGVLTCYLAQKFPRVIAIDRDPQMAEATGELIEKLRARGAPFGEIEIRCEDWAESDDLNGRADLLCAVNSILEPRPEDRRQLLAKLRSTLKNESSRLLAVFPAMEAQIHLLRLFSAELDARGIEGEELYSWIEQELVIAHSFDAYEGTFSSRNEPPQKFCYQLELCWELAAARLRVDEMSRITYPWEVCRDVDAGYFPAALELFDWFVVARKEWGRC